MIGEAPVCVVCKHLILEKGPLRCKAFPEGIPENITLGGNDHKKPFKGDHGIQFSPL